MTVTDLLAVVFTAITLWPWWAPVTVLAAVLLVWSAHRGVARTDPDGVSARLPQCPDGYVRRCPDRRDGRVRRCPDTRRTATVTCGDSVRTRSRRTVSGHDGQVS